jgi:hypothetical protein
MSRATSIISRRSARGIFPLYGTSSHNRASQRVAAKLGLIRVAGSLSIA